MYNVTTSANLLINKMSNVHAWFANQTINNAASWVDNFFETTNAQPAAALSNKVSFKVLM